MARTKPATERTHRFEPTLVTGNADCACEVWITRNSPNPAEDYIRHLEEIADTFGEAVTART